MKFSIIKISLLILLWASTGNCRNPTSETFQRNSPSDPGSQNFDPSLQLSSDLKVQLQELNMFRVSWPPIFGVEKYQLLRNEYESNNFELLWETNTYSDTTYIDALSVSGSYSYLIKYISTDDDTLSLQSDYLLSNWIEGPDLSFNTDENSIYLGLSYAMKTGVQSALVHFLSSDSNAPIFSKIDLITNNWEIIQFDNLITSSDIPRTNDFVLVNDSKFLIVNKFQSTQNYLGYLCTIENATCSQFGNTSFDNNDTIRRTASTLLPDGRIILIGGETVVSRKMNFAFIFDPTDDSVIKISPPKNTMVPNTLSLLKDGNVIACSGSPEIGALPSCQNYNLITNSWSNSNSIPEPFYNMSSSILNDDRILFLDDNFYRDDGNNVWILNSELNSWVKAAPTNFGTEYIFHGEFVNSLQKTPNGDIVTLTEIPFNNDLYRFSEIAVEVFNPDLNEWGKIYFLPKHVKFIYNFIKLDQNRFLITYSSRGFPHSSESYMPKSAIIYID
tara:strand:+ start:74280 stop:75785 length:1506 start_codon:yes stop_codon:yes gene_type:complete